jgi:Xaa-Pro aminopeptidase
MERFAQGPFHVAYERRVDLDALRRKRIARADEQRKKAGLDALLVWKDENCRLPISDRSSRAIDRSKKTALNGALLIEGKAPILFCSGGERDRVDRTMPWIEEVHTIPIIEEKALVEGMVKDILGPVLQKYGLTDVKLGLDEANTVFTKALSARFRKLRIEDGDTPMQQARMIKLPEEIVLLEEATAIADAVTATGISAVRECEVAAEAMRTLFRLGPSSVTAHRN